jgi:hypothetical protein
MLDCDTPRLLALRTLLRSSLGIRRTRLATVRWNLFEKELCRYPRRGAGSSPWVRPWEKRPWFWSRTAFLQPTTPMPQRCLAFATSVFEVIASFTRVFYEIYTGGD